MEFRFASRVSSMKASAVREMLKLTAAQGRHLVRRRPAAERVLPVGRDRRSAAADRVGAGRACAPVLDDRGLPGAADAGSRSACAGGWAWRYGADDVLVTTGSQQALDLTGKVFLDEGDVVFCESPTYLAAISAFRACRRVLRGGALRRAGDDRLGAGAAGFRLRARAARLRDTRTSRIPRAAPGRSRGARSCSRWRRASSCRSWRTRPYRELRFEGEELPALVVARSRRSRDLHEHVLEGPVPGPAHRLDRRAAARRSRSTCWRSRPRTCTPRRSRSSWCRRSWRSRTSIVTSPRSGSVCRERRDAMLRAADEWLPREVRVSRPGRRPVPVARAAARARRAGVAAALPGARRRLRAGRCVLPERRRRECGPHLLLGQPGGADRGGCPADGGRAARAAGRRAALVAGDEGGLGRRPELSRWPRGRGRASRAASRPRLAVSRASTIGTPRPPVRP